MFRIRRAAVVIDEERLLIILEREGRIGRSRLARRLYPHALFPKYTARRVGRALEQMLERGVYAPIIIARGLTGPCYALSGAGVTRAKRIAWRHNIDGLEETDREPRKLARTA
jgi:hypothetical protein